MKSVNVISTLGVSPPVVTEFIDWCLRVGYKPRKVFCIGTKDETVKQSFNVIKVALDDKFRIKSEYIELPFDDPIKEEDFVLTVEKILDITKGYKSLFNLAGGRKNTVLAGYLSAMLTGSKVFHIIHTDVKSLNVDLEKIRYELEIVGKDPKKYKEYKDKLEPVLFPNPQVYEVIEIPVIPLTYSIKEIIKRAFGGGKEIRIDLEEIRNELEYVDYVRITLSGKIIITGLK